MSVLIDTSAFFAVLDAGDEYHQRADEIWRSLVLGEERLLSTSYVLVETIALVQRRLGITALRVFQEDVMSLITIEWVDESSHRAAMTGLLSSGRKRLSLVDFVSFDAMRRFGIKTAFTFDRHFREQGFGCLPS